MMRTVVAMTLACGTMSLTACRDDPSEDAADEGPAAADDGPGPTSGEYDSAPSPPEGEAHDTSGAGERGAAGELERETIERLLEPMQAFASAAVAADGDCDDIAAAIRELVDDHGPALATASAQTQGARTESRRNMEAQLLQAVPDLGEALEDMMGCRDHAGVRAGLEALYAF